MSELICNELAKSYSHFQLYPTSFQLESGYLTVLAGKNGSGKSTLLRCLAGIDPACTGDVTLDGISLKKSLTATKIKLVMYQRNSLILWKIRSGKRRASGPLFFQLVHGTLLYADGPDEFSPSKQLWQLSKGEYMKMQTCFALAHHPRFLILDEPLEGFDPVFRKTFYRLCRIF